MIFAARLSAKKSGMIFSKNMPSASKKIYIFVDLICRSALRAIRKVRKCLKRDNYETYHFKF